MRMKQGAYTAIPTTARLSKVAYQNSRLEKNENGVSGANGRDMKQTHSCVDLTIEKPRFSDVWKLDTGQPDVRIEDTVLTVFADA